METKELFTDRLDRIFIAGGMIRLDFGVLADVEERDDDDAEETTGALRVIFTPRGFLHAVEKLAAVAALLNQAPLPPTPPAIRKATGKAEAETPQDAAAVAPPVRVKRHYSKRRTFSPPGRHMKRKAK